MSDSVSDRLLCRLAGFGLCARMHGPVQPRGNTKESVMSSSNWIERLEDRQLLAATPIPANINLSKMRGSQSEGAVAVDPTNGSRIFVVSNIDRGDGLFTARSSDGGGHWSKKVIATGSDGLA